MVNSKIYLSKRIQFGGVIMSFEPEFTKINLSSEKGALCEQLKVEVKTEISTDEVAEVLSISAFATVLENQVDNGAVDYGGKVIFYLSYVDTEGSLKKCECGSQFKGCIKDAIATDAHAYVTAKTVKCESDRSGVKLGVTAYVDVCVKLDGTVALDALAGGENLVVESDEITVLKGVGHKTLNFPVEEEFELNYAVEEVLSHSANAVITMVQCGVNCIIVDGEVILSAILLQKGGKSDIIKEVKTLPFRAEIECEDAMPNMQAVARVSEKSFKTDVSVDEENSKSTVFASVNLVFEGEAFTTDSVSVAKDAFSIEQEIELVKKETCYYKTCDLRSCSAVVTGRSAVNELPVGAIVLAVSGERAEVVSKKCEGEDTIVAGVLTATGYFRDGDGKVFVQTLETPFECSLGCAFECDVDLDIRALAKRAKLKIISLTEVETESELCFTVYPAQKQNVCYVCEIKPLGEKRKNNATVSVYIPCEGEELWSLAKRLNVCPDSLMQTNPELQFPLTGKERIVVYRQK